MDKSFFIKRNYLTEAQKHLYALICVKVANNEKITFEEARRIYVTYVCKYNINGVPHYFNYWANQIRHEDGSYTYTGKIEPMRDWQIDGNTTNWLVQNLGKLVIKGVLDVMPQVELKRIAGSSQFGELAEV